MEEGDGLNKRSMGGREEETDRDRGTEELEEGAEEGAGGEGLGVPLFLNRARPLFIYRSPIPVIGETLHTAQALASKSLLLLYFFGGVHLHACSCNYAHPSQHSWPG